MSDKVPASLHIITHSTAGAARMLARMRLLHHDLRDTPGLVAGHLFSTDEFWPPMGSYPTLRRWALLSAFVDDEALAAFEESRPVKALGEHARESWRVTLEPTRVVNGSRRRWCPATEGVEPLARDEPLAVMTYGVLRPRYAPWFLQNSRRVVRAAIDQEGLIARLGMHDAALATCTFSIWRSQRDVARFAYAAGTAHKPLIRPALDTPTHDKMFFARFRLRDAEGTLAATRSSDRGARRGGRQRELVVAATRPGTRPTHALAFGAKEASRPSGWHP